MIENNVRHRASSHVSLNMGGMFVSFGGSVLKQELYFRKYH